MKLSIVCKASSSIGLGHLIRSYSFVSQAVDAYPDLHVDYVIVGDTSLSRLIVHPKISPRSYHTEHEVELGENTDFLILDVTDIDRGVLSELQNKASKTVVISPVFNAFDQVDYYFGRTKYLNFDPENYPELKVFSGLQYTIIQENCSTISAGTFEENLASKFFPIAIAMGGGDAKNKTLEVLRSLKKCKIPAIFWVMVGQGYKHSVDNLVDEIRKNSSHEIILARTNSSMWRILNNCVLSILPGGITTYEAVHAGLPSINFFEQENQQFLLREILEYNAAWDFGIYSKQTLVNIAYFIEHLYENRKLLMQMHVNTKAIIDKGGTMRILKELRENL